MPTPVAVLVMEQQEVHFATLASFRPTQNPKLNDRAPYSILVAHEKSDHLKKERNHIKDCDNPQGDTG